MREFKWNITALKKKQNVTERIKVEIYGTTKSDTKQQHDFSINY